jgi:hypothetical protein
MYIARVLNSANLFQYLGGWKVEGDNPENPGLDEFFFRATAAYLSLIRMRLLIAVCLEEYRKHKKSLNLKSDRIVFWSPTFVQLLNEFSPFLSALMIMQNLLLPLVGRALNVRKDIPLSFREAIKKLRVCGFNDEISRIAMEYWSSGGSEIRNYRDIDQHYHAIVQHSFLQISPVERALIYLPDDPQDRSRRRATFLKERDALVYFENAFVKFHAFVERVAALLGFQPAAIGQTVGMAQLGQLDDGIRKTLALMIDDSDRISGIEIGQTEMRTVYIRPLTA